MNKAILKNYKSLGLKTLKLSQIKLDQGIYPRFETDEERAKFFAKLLEEGNQFEPIIVAPTETEGLYELLDGNHRLLAHQIAGKEEIRAEIYDVPKEERRLIAAGLNNKTSKPLSEGELKDAIVKAYTVDGIKDLKKIASLIGCSVRTVERYTKEVREREREEKVRKAKELREKGWKIKDIAKELKVPESTIKDWLKTKSDKLSEIVLLLPTGAPTPEGLRLFSEFVELKGLPEDLWFAQIVGLQRTDTLNHKEVPTLVHEVAQNFAEFLKAKGYTEVKEEALGLVQSVRSEVLRLAHKLSEAGLSPSAIKAAISKESSGLFKNLSSMAKAKIAQSFTKYLERLQEERRSLCLAPHLPHDSLHRLGGRPARPF